jgi:glutamate-1-semialdehyde 2,1-aminomutase
MATEQVKAPKSVELGSNARQYLPGGVGASARYNPALGTALYVSRGEGARIWDVDGRSYLDFNLSHGATFLGHHHPGTTAAVREALDRGAICGYDSPSHTEFAKLLCETVPAAERVRFCNSGSEATLTAIRLARAVTDRRKVLKFWGHFHGLHDYVLYNAHSPNDAKPGQLITPNRESAGIPPELDSLMLVIPWKDQEALDLALRLHAHEIAAVIMEPINYNQGCIVASKEYMETVRRRCDEHGIVLIYDEVLSAFRTGPECAQGYYGVTPDLCSIGKAVANGVPIAVLAGRARIMDGLAPTGEAAHSGTYSGHLFAILAGLAALQEMRRPGFYDRLGTLAHRFYNGLNRIFTRHGLTAHAQGLGARFGIHFGRTEPVTNYAETVGEDKALAARFIRAAFDHGVYFHDYGRLVIGHHGFSAAHTEADIDEALTRIDDAVADLQRDRTRGTTASTRS